MKKREIFMIAVTAFTTGLALGFLTSPTKNGIGNNSGNNTNNYYLKKHSDND